MKQPRFNINIITSRLLLKFEQNFVGPVQTNIYLD